MPAKNLHRVDTKGIYSHIYNKGVEKRIIFNDEEDYSVFLGYLKDYLTTPRDPSSLKKVFEVHGRTFQGTPHQPKNYFNQVELVAYSLMPDHFHLLLRQVSKGSLEKFMRSLTTRYSIYFNKKYHHSGSVFQGPYKSVGVEGTHLPQLISYFHLGAKYSSASEYLGPGETTWVKTETALAFIDQDKGLPDSEAKKKGRLLESMVLEDENSHLRDSSRDSEKTLAKDGPDSKEVRSPSRQINFFITSTALFLLLVTVGLGNIKLSEASNFQRLQQAAVLSATKQSKPEIVPQPTPPPKEKTEATSEAKPNEMVTVSADNETSIVNIRQKPDTGSAKVGQAKDGDTFELMSADSGWFEIKLEDGSTGFISSKYIEIDKNI